MRLPVDNVFITQPYGGQHTGTDFRAAHGSNIYNTSDGIGKKIGWDPDGYGWYADIDHGSYIDRYGHFMVKPTWRIGSFLPEGAVVGLADNTGRSTGDHLHYEVFTSQMNYLLRRRVDPYQFIINTMNELAHKFDGKTIIVPDDNGRWYWVSNGKKQWIPDLLTGWSFGLLPEDAVGVAKLSANIIPDGTQLQYNDGKFHRLLEDVRQHKDKL